MGANALKTSTPRAPPMNLVVASEAPPTDFVAFLAQRAGLSAEAAEHRLENWFHEYHAASTRRPAANSNVGHAAPAAASTF
jgi:hypothetical protein